MKPGRAGAASSLNTPTPQLWLATVQSRLGAADLLSGNCPFFGQLALLARNNQAESMDDFATKNGIALNPGF
jgi:hypothetical protein